jgi:hypothetical protein
VSRLSLLQFWTQRVISLHKPSNMVSMDNIMQSEQSNSVEIWNDAIHNSLTVPLCSIELFHSSYSFSLFAFMICFQRSVRSYHHGSTRSLLVSVSFSYFSKEGKFIQAHKIHSLSHPILMLLLLNWIRTCWRLFWKLSFIKESFHLFFISSSLFIVDFSMVQLKILEVQSKTSSHVCSLHNSKCGRLLWYVCIVHSQIFFIIHVLVFLHSLSISNLFHSNSKYCFQIWSR